MSHRAFVACVLSLATISFAQPQLADLPYWPTADRPAYAQFEAALTAVPTRESLLAWHQLLASEPHIAGTPGDLRNVDRIAKAFTDMGLEVEKHEFWALLARPVAAAVEVMEPEHVSLLVREDILVEDPFSGNPDQTIGWNAYSGSGDVSAAVVYANYGTKADFAKLAELKVDTTGKIILCRYGGNFRGYKARFAEAAGAAGVIIYTDPADSGYAKGITYPEGGYSNSTCIERGSIDTLPYPGDPLTPGIEATENAKRLDPATIDLPKIPVQPVGWVAAAEIMKRMTGEGVPTAWQGGLPFAYRVTGGDKLKVRLKVQQDRKIIPTFNIIATLKGATEPDRWMILGCHHDAWNCGAADPLAGTITLMEAAKAFSQLAKEGKRPARTIKFCAWGAEEFGIIGSTEWVEANRTELIDKGIAYINLDMASMGVDFGAATSPSLRRLIAECAKAVPQARDKTGKTVFEAWLARGEDPLFPGQPKFGEMGGGSDHIGFLCHCAIPCTSLGAGGSKGNSYHSTYDTLPWYWKVVGEDYEPAIMITRMASAVASRLASAPLVPLEPARYGSEVHRHLIDLTKRGVEAGLFAKSEGEVARVFEQLDVAAGLCTGLSESADEVLRRAAGEGKKNMSDASLRIMRSERAWLLDAGIPGRPWFKSLYAASDEDSGYAAWPLPGLRWCIEHKDTDELQRQVKRYQEALTQVPAAVILRIKDYAPSDNK